MSPHSKAFISSNHFLTLLLVRTAEKTYQSDNRFGEVQFKKTRSFRTCHTHGTLQLTGLKTTLFAPVYFSALSGTAEAGDSGILCMLHRFR